MFFLINMLFLTTKNQGPGGGGGGGSAFDTSSPTHLSGLNHFKSLPKISLNHIFNKFGKLSYQYWFQYQYSWYVISGTHLLFKQAPFW